VQTRLSITKVLSGILLTGLVALRASADEPVPPAALDLVTQNEVLIKATPAEIWPQIVAPNAWKSGPKLLVVSGEPTRIGATFNAVMPDSPQKIEFHAENVEMVAQRRRTIRLNAPDGALIGFAMWELTPRNGATLVEYRVYSQVAIPPQNGVSMTPSELAAVQANYYNVNYQRFDAELATLKQLVERQR
jgi:hypothetical protein